MEGAVMFEEQWEDVGAMLDALRTTGNLFATNEGEF